MSIRDGQRTIFLRASRDIETVKRCGRRIATELFNLLMCRIDAGPTRVAIIVGKRFGNAVQRNRVKRVFRALVRQWHGEFVPGHAILVFPKRDALKRCHQDLNHLWEDTLHRIHIIMPSKSD